MRSTTRPVLGVLLAVAVGSTGFGQETKAPWWHFGRDKSEVTSAPPAVTAAPTLTPSQTITPADVAPVEDESWLSWPSMPKMTWLEPKPESAVTDPFATNTQVTTTNPRPQRSHFGKTPHATRPRNTWAQQPASTTTTEPATSPWKSMTSGTRTAWHKTVDFVTPGDGAAEAPVVATDTDPSWWDKMWGAEEKQEGPQTVTEWMAQDRLDP